MKKLLFILTGAFLGIASAFAQDDTRSDLMISEYLEGSSNNKAIEIYNGTGQDVDLSAYKLVKEVNGETGKTSELELKGTLKAGHTMIIVNDQNNCLQAIRDLANGPVDIKESNKIMNFNGNDAVMLYKGETKIDVVGVEGQVADWGKDVTLRRKCDKGPNPVYTPAEWDTVKVDDYSDLTLFCGSDMRAPKIQYAVTNGKIDTVVDIYVNKYLDSITAKLTANYTMEGFQVKDAVLATGGKKITLTLDKAMTVGTKYKIFVNNVEDTVGNKMENDSVEFSFGYQEVEDLAALCAMRSTYVQGQKYKVKGDLVITAIVGKFGTSQTTTNAWVQDKGCDKAVGHSMMLYYVNDLLKDAKVGQVIRGLCGELTVYNDLIEMQYFDTAAIELTQDTAAIVIDEVKISDLKGKDKLTYQNAMVRIKSAKYADAGKTFEGNKSYNITDGTTIAFRTNREGDYLGKKIPAGEVDVVGYVGYYSGSCQVSPRTKEDCGVKEEKPVDTTAVENAAAIQFTVYPNPTKGMLNVELTEGGMFGLHVYGMNGAVLLRREGLSDKAQIDLSGLAKGMYVVEIRTAEGSVRTKVVVK